jgi:hypothetical protein
MDTMNPMPISHLLATQLIVKSEKRGKETYKPDWGFRMTTPIHVVASSVPINCIQSHPNSAFLTRQKNPSTTDMLCRPNPYSPEHDEQFQSFDHPASMLPQEPLFGVLLLPSYPSLQNSSKGELT